MTGVTCTFVCLFVVVFLDMLGRTQFKISGWVTLGPNKFLKLFLASSYDRSSLHEFSSFFPEVLCRM